MSTWRPRPAGSAWAPGWPVPPWTTCRELGVRRIVLATADAHDRLRKAGFAPLAEPDRWMEIDLRRHRVRAR